MEFKFNEEFEKYINDHSIDIVKLIKPIARPNFGNSASKGNLENVPPKVIKNVLDVRHFVRWENEYKKLVKIIEIDQHNSYGFEEKDFTMVRKLIDHVYKINDVRNYISYQSIEMETLNWLFRKYRDNKFEESISIYLRNKFSELVNQYNVYIPIVYLDIWRTFQLGNVRIMYFSKGELDILENNFYNDKGKNDNSFQSLKEFLNGQVFAQVTVTAEYGKAQEIAFSEASLTIDCLRILSPVSSYPLTRSNFDLDSRSNVLLVNDIVVQETNSPHHFKLSKARNAEIYEVNDNEWKELIEKQIEFFHDFLTNCDRTKEINMLAFKSINLFSLALKDNVLPSRISKLFSIYESLVLQNDDDPILSSLVKYVPKIICEKVEQRLEVIKVLKDFYKIRSKYVHHAKLDEEFDIKGLKRLQLNLLILIMQFIQLGTRYDKKEEIIMAIDTEMLKAFSLKELFHAKSKTT